jgi:hypothetical protein
MASNILPKTKLKRKKRSYVWLFFDQNSINKIEQNVYCKRCQTKVFFDSASTSTLIYHLSHVHNIHKHNYKTNEFASKAHLQNKQQDSDSNCEFSDENEAVEREVQPSTISEKKYKLLNENLLDFIISSNQPFSTSIIWNLKSF